ncbi:MAG: hypothetical protein JJU46_04795 [Balneolaceae bacterium]|nr:hypothetical protein [Balneolaceae bacterium]MCH8549726.1 hypothetical protein [Balneolaceae bacterium]
MKQLKLRLLSGLIVAGFLLTGCFDDIVKVYDGPAVVEFAQYQQPGSPSNNFVSTLTFPAGAEDSSAEVSYLLQLIAPHFDSDTNIGFVVADAQLDRDGEPVQNTTAVEGQHFNLLTNNNVAVFPANSSTSSIDVEVLSANLDPGQSVQFILQLVDGDQLAPAENYKYFRVVVAKAAS